ncbi:MAG: sigma-70 family RNA polymerase sigma factor [Candidatus Goldiibacteriota bacterium]
MEEISFDEIKRLQNGERMIFDRIILIYKQRVTALCFKYMRNMEEALDSSQEVFVAVYSNIKSFRFQSKFSTWLYRLTVNNCINRLKTIKRRESLMTAGLPDGDGGFVELAEMLRDKVKLPDEEMELKELGTTVLKELERFSAADKSVIILLDMEGFSCAEAGDILGKPEGSIRSSASRTRRKLREMLERKGVSLR